MAAEPGSPRGRLSARRLEATQAEIAHETAASLGRAAERLQRALAAMAEPAPSAAEAERRLGAAAEALWYCVVQREACGLRDVSVVLREYQVPPEVYVRMGPARPEQGGPPAR